VPSVSGTGVPSFDTTTFLDSLKLHPRSHAFTMSTAVRAPGEASSSKALTHSGMNSKLKDMKYAVRGDVPIAAERIQKELDSGTSKRPYTEILACNIGNPHSVGQTPVSWFRQVMALVNCPELSDTANFPEDVKARAKLIRSQVGGGTGAYSHSKGISAFRDNVARFIERRDGYPADPEQIFLCAGASAGIEKVMSALIAGPQDAVLVPIPQYPLYSALITLMGGNMVGYYLDEEKNWGFNLATAKEALAKARADGLNPKGMVVINPGNPTGQVMSQADLTDIVKMCKEEGLLLMSDEVYQENVYVDNKKFVSMKKVVRDLGKDYDDFELVSFHSTSKGLIGECGRRGGFMELCGMDSGVVSEIFKLACMGLCPNLDGQMMTGLMVDPPKEGEPSYKLYHEECSAIYSDLKRKSKIVVDALNDIEGMSCQVAEGAMYAFPKIDLGPGAIKAAEAAGQAPDLFYCLALLEETGICCVPGSGFAQVPGTYHFRTTFLPPADKLEDAMKRFKKFHEDFRAKYN